MQADFFQHEDVISIAENLIGKIFLTQIQGDLTGGIITEVEAYRAPEDKASHAYNFRRTLRTSTMFRNGGILYVYLCYGIHHLVNIVTGPEDMPHAILIRSIEPCIGMDAMAERRNLKKWSPRIASGPGCASKALGLSTAQNGIPLSEESVWIEDDGILVNSDDIHRGPRVGIDYAEEWIDTPWRFGWKHSKWISKPKF